MRGWLAEAYFGSLGAWRGEGERPSGVGGNKASSFIPPESAQRERNSTDGQKSSSLPLLPATEDLGSIQLDLPTPTEKPCLSMCAHSWFLSSRYNCFEMEYIIIVHKYNYNHV